MLGGLLLGGCVPALVVTSPAVSGQVTDGRTGQPVAGALVTVRVGRGVPSTDQPVKRASQVLSDGDGQFALPEQYGVGLLSLIGDPPIYRAVVRVTKEGYAGFTTTQQCNGTDGEPSKPVHVFPALNPERRSR